MGRTGTLGDGLMDGLFELAMHDHVVLGVLNDFDGFMLLRTSTLTHRRKLIKRWFGVRKLYCSKYREK
jgi:hypothetical protein